MLGSLGFLCVFWGMACIAVGGEENAKKSEKEDQAFFVGMADPHSIADRNDDARRNGSEDESESTENGEVDDGPTLV
jgi:hypothetical protein